MDEVLTNTALKTKGCSLTEPVDVSPSLPYSIAMEALAPQDDLTVTEEIDGQIFVSPRPRWGHAKRASRLGAILIPPYDFAIGGPGGWWIIDEPELHLGRRPDKLSPDLAGWRRERLDDPPDETAAITVAPDWVCEVLSPSTEEVDRVRKRRVYRREQVRHLWFLDPLARVLEVFALEGTRYVLLGEYGEDEVINAEPFAELALDLRLLWSRR